jgi:hypothetical protein
LIIGNQQQATALLKHFGSSPQLARGSVQELSPFLLRSNALRLVGRRGASIVAVIGPSRGHRTWAMPREALQLSPTPDMIAVMAGWFSSG